MLSVLCFFRVNALVIVPLDEVKLYITMHLLVFEWLYIPDMVTGVFILLFLICNDFSSVIEPTSVAISIFVTFPIVGPNRGDL